ncbi:hypothetical protein AL047_22360 [Pseudomonas syringae pv. broussonetiae]|nr:hypothetical protein AL047_22360 [Pseudomonas syringae pv. broussonetiae]
MKKPRLCKQAGLFYVCDSGKYIDCRSGPGDASLVRELPGTGSKTSCLGAPDTNKMAGFGSASQPIADESAPTFPKIADEQSGARFHY